MRKIALGRLSIPAREFYFYTLAELFDALQGHEEQESQRLQWHLWGVRKQIAFTLIAAGAKDVKEEEIIPLEMDEELRKQRLKEMPYITVTVNGEAERQ